MVGAVELAEIGGPADTTSSTEEPGATKAELAGSSLITEPALYCELLTMVIVSIFSPAAVRMPRAWAWVIPITLGTRTETALDEVFDVVLGPLTVAL